jgi:hypothetical protein
MGLSIAPGAAAVPVGPFNGALCVSDAIETVTLGAAPPAGQERFDWVTVYPRGNDLDGGANNDFIFNVIAGTAGPPTAPFPIVPAGQLGLYRIHVGGGVAAIVAGDIVDFRPRTLSSPGGFHYEIIGPTSQIDCTAERSVQNIFTPIPPRRRVKVTAYARGYNAGTAGGQCEIKFYPPGTNPPWGDQMVVAYACPANAWFAGSTHWLYNNDTDDSYWLQGGIWAMGINATCRMPTNSCRIVVEDIGPSTK